jgi:LysR family transcriptional regulator, nod-box dependent transcriptional activator
MLGAGGARMKLSQVDLNLLVALDALLRTRNVTQAGREIGLSQPAMSAALSRLRHMFGDRLFERVGGEYRLTPLAEALADPLQAALGAVQRTLEHKAHFDPARSTRCFKLALSDHLLLVLCPQLIVRLNELAPNIVVHTYPVTPDVGAHIGARRIDLSIQPANLVEDCASAPLFEDRWICAAWSKNPELREGLTKEKLYALPHASFGPGPVPLAEQLITPPLGTKPNIQVITRSFACLPFMLPGTGLIAVIQRSLGEWARRQADIQMMELPIPTPRLTFEMSWNAAFSADLALTWLRNVVSEVVAESFGPAAQAQAG